MWTIWLRKSETEQHGAERVDTYSENTRSRQEALATGMVCTIECKLFFEIQIAPSVHVNLRALASAHGACARYSECSVCAIHKCEGVRKWGEAT